MFAAANKNGVEIGTLGQVYSRVSMVSKELGASQSEMLKFIDGVTAALKVQGGSAEQSSGALLQLSQALGSGVVHAEEFNSVLEGALPIAQAAARGMDGMGGSVAKLRAAVVDGKVSSSQFFEALLKGFGETQNQADKASATIGQAMTGLNNNMVRFVGTLDQTAGASKIVTAGIDTMSEALARLTKEASTATGALAAVLKFGVNPVGFAASLVTPSSGTMLTDQIDIAKSALERAQNDFEGARNPRTRAAYEAVIERQKAALVDLERQRQVATVGGKAGPGLPDDPDAIGFWMKGKPAVPPPKSGGGGGESPEEKYRKLISQLGTAADAQDALTRAIDAGGAEVEKTKGHWDAMAKVQEIFGHRLDDNSKFVTDLEAAMGRLSDSKLRQGFIEGTKDLERQNELLGLQIGLMGQGPEIIAKETAALKIKQEIERSGVKLSDDEIARRTMAVEVSEKLRLKQEEIARAQELWMEPAKQALQDIQRLGSDAWESFLQSGKFSFDELSKVFTTTLRRMAAEFLTLATVRPVMSIVLNTISPSMAQSMGLGAGSLFPGASGGTSVGGGGLLGGLGGMMSGVGSWLSSPIMGADAINNAAMVASVTNTPLSFGSTLGGLTWGQGIAGAAGIGAGIYGLLTSKTPSGMIGGISSILGAGVSLIPGIGQIAGPAIALLGNLLPGLFGLDGTPPTITNQSYAQLSYGSGGWYTTGGAWGPSANSSATQQGLAGLGGGISSVFSLLGGVKDPSKVWGLSATNKTVSGKDWSSSSDSTFLVDPSGNQTLWRMNEANMMDTGAEQVARASILGGAVGDITENMRKAVQSIGETTSATLQELASAISEIQAFDKAIAGLGKTTTSAEQAIAQIDQQFASLYDTASKYGLATGDLDTAKAKARLDYANNFGADIEKQLLQMTDPRAAAMADVDEWQKTMTENNRWLLDNVQGTQDRLAEIERLGGLKRAQIAEQATSQTLGGIKEAIVRLTYGDLSGASPTATLEGMTGSYNAMLAQANAGNATAVAGIAGAATGLAQFGGSYFGTATPAYQSLVGGLASDLRSVYTAQGGAASDLPGAIGSAVTGLATVSSQLGELVFTLQKGDETDEELKANMATIIDQLTRLLAKLAA